MLKDHDRLSVNDSGIADVVPRRRPKLDRLGVLVKEWDKVEKPWRLKRDRHVFDVAAF